MVNFYRRAILLGPNVDRDLLRSVSKRETDVDWVQRELRAQGHCSSDLRVGVDGGNRFWKEINIPPQIAIGDWDSLAEVSGAMRGSKLSAEYKEFLKDAQFLTLPRKKDRSDLHYALRVVKDLKIQQILCLGFTGGRADHHLAHLLELGAIAAQPKAQKITSIGPEAGYYWVSPSNPLVIERLGPISVFAWNGKAEGVNLEGMEYRLKNAKLEPSSQGLSNRVVSKAQISVKRGLLLVIVPMVSVGGEA